MLYIIVLKNNNEYINPNNFDKLKSNSTYSYTFYPEYILVDDKKSSNNNDKNKHQNYLLDRINQYRMSKSKINLIISLVENINIILKTIESSNLYDLDTFKIKLKNDITSINEFSDKDIVNSIGLNESEMNKMMKFIHTSKKRSKYSPIVDKMMQSIQNANKIIVDNTIQITDVDRQNFELINEEIQKVMSIFRDLNIQNNKTKYYTSQYFEEIDESIEGYYTITNYDTDINFTFQSHFFQNMMKDKEMIELYYEYIYLLYEPILNNIIYEKRGYSLQQEENEKIEYIKTLKKQFINVSRNIKISQKEWIRAKINDYINEKKNTLKNESIEYLKDVYIHNTKILQNINKSKQDYSNLLTNKNTSIWFVQLDFDFNTENNEIKNIDKIKKKVNIIDTKDTHGDKCDRSNEYFNTSWTKRIDENLKILIHDDPKKIKSLFSDFKSYLYSIFS